MTTETLEAVRKSVLVAATPERAWEVFTAGIGDWWPLATHSLGGERAETAVIEPREGGRVYETQRDGTEAPWGTVLVWEPPRRLVLEWKVNPDAAAPTEVEVRFAPEAGGTRVDLEHRAWERLGEAAAATRENYDGGWELVLGEYERGVGAA